MENIFKNQTTEGFAPEEDRIGGGGTVTSGAYDAIIKMLFVAPTKKGGSNLVLEALLDMGEGKKPVTYRETIFVMNEKGENFYIDKQGDKQLYPGYQMADSLCLMTNGFQLSDQDMEIKTQNIYDYDTKKEVPTEVPVLMGMLDQPITLGIQEIKSFKQKSVDGKYEDTSDTRKTNETKKVFRTECKRTSTEVRAGLETAVFYDAWCKANTDELYDKTKGKGGGASKEGAPGQKTGDKAAPKKSLFGKK
ncbi:MAG: hypothetical protein JKY54_11255 [Flavobacteriales bacterium]|nr:hypothetical protein [Flavobacteriales bacterium]